MIEGWIREIERIDLGEAERPGTVVRALSVTAGSNVASLQADGWRAASFEQAAIK